MNENINTVPDIKISVKQTFGIDSNLEVDAFSKKNEYVPEIDKNYKFDKDTTLAILSGFSFNKRVLVQGYHGTGKSTHIEQVAARLNWPCIRVNLDSHISRIDLIGKDAITIKDGKQITEFQEGILPWSIQNPIALVFDEYDAGRPDVMFVIQRVLEAEGNFTLLDKNKVLKQHKYFRLFATSNTVGLGDTTGIYHGTQQINQGQMDRWNIVTSLNYLSLEKEMEIILAKNKSYNNSKGKEEIANMIKVASLTRKGFVSGDISTVMSPRTVMHWAENNLIFKDIGYSFRVTFLNKCDEVEKNIIAEYYQRCFGEDLPEATYAEKIIKTEGKITWNDSSMKIIGKINGLHPNPGGYFIFNGDRYKILKAEIGNGSGHPGEVLNDKLEIACSNNESIKVIEIQKEGKKIQEINEFLNGSNIHKGCILNE